MNTELKAAMKATKKTKQAKRMRLYEQGLSDKEIAKIEGCSSSTIHNWRRKKGLEIKGHNRHSFAPMEAVLTPDECAEVGKFFSYLLKYADIADSRAEKLDVGRFMREYIEVAPDLKPLNYKREKGGV